MRAATPKHQAPNRCTTAVARSTCTLIHGESLLHLPIAVRSCVVIDGRAASRNRFAKQRDDCAVESLGFGGSKRASDRQRMQSRAPQRFIDVDVAQPCDESLIEQQALQPTTPTFQGGCEVHRREGRL